MTHKTEPARQAAFLIIHEARGRRAKCVGVSAGRREKRIGVSACRRIGVVGLPSCASGVARPRNVRPTYEKAPLLEAAGKGFGPCNAGRAGAQPYRATRADTPIRRPADTPIRFSRRHVSPVAP